MPSPLRPPDRKRWLRARLPTLTSYAGTAAICVGVCSLLWFTGSAVPVHESFKAIFYACLGPLSGGARGLIAAAFTGMAIGVGLLFPRNALARLIGSVAIALWFMLGLAFSAERLA